MNQKFSQALAAGAISVATWVSPALADRVLSGAEAHKMLSGQTFEFNCVDGTRGEASYAKSGVATASFRLSGANSDAAVQRDHGRVRVEGENLCIRWGTLNGGKEGCYKMVERRPGMYRISEGQLRWCELNGRRGTTESASND